MNELVGLECVECLSLYSSVLMRLRVSSWSVMKGKSVMFNAISWVCEVPVRAFCRVSLSWFLFEVLAIGLWRWRYATPVRIWLVFEEKRNEEKRSRREVKSREYIYTVYICYILVRSFYILTYKRILEDFEKVYVVVSEVLSFVSESQKDLISMYHCVAVEVDGGMVVNPRWK